MATTILTTTDTVGNTGNSNVKFYIISGTPTAPAQRVTVAQYPASNAGFSRACQLTSDYVFIKRGTSSFAIPISDLANIAAEQVPALSYSPLVTLQPVATECNSAASPPDNYANFTMLANSESTLSYFWMQNAAGVWTMISNGVDNGANYIVEGPNLSVQPTDNTQNGFGVLCIANNATGNTNTSEVTLTVT